MRPSSLTRHGTSGRSTPSLSEVRRMLARFQRATRHDKPERPPRSRFTKPAR